GEDDLSGAKPAPTLAVPLVSPPTPPTSWARHAPCGRFGIEAILELIAVFGENERSSCCITTRKKTRSLKIAVQISQMKQNKRLFPLCFNLRQSAKSAVAFLLRASAV